MKKMKEAIKEHRILLCGGAFVMICVITATIFAILSGTEADLFAMVTWDGHAVGFLLVVGLFLLGAALDRADSRLLLPAAAEALTAVGYLAFAAESANRVSTLWLPLGGCLLAAAFLSLCLRRSGFLHVGKISLLCGATLGVWFLLSLLLQRRPATVGPEALPLCLSRVLAMVCECVAVSDMLFRLQRRLREAQALTERNMLLLDNCHILERSIRDTSAMRHEWKNNILALQLVAQREDLNKLRSMLSRLGDQLERMSPRQFSPNFTVNAILRSAAYQAQEREIQFDASANLPPELHIDADDLCSFLMNMLDNALREASEAPAGQRSVEISLKLSHGYLAILCENTFDENLSTDVTGHFLSAGPPEDGANPGLARMRFIAGKYSGMVDISCIGQRFTVNAALKNE